MSTDTRVVPVGDEDGTVGRYTNVGGAEPFISGPRHDVLNLCLVASPIIRHGVSPNDVWPCIAVEDLIPEDFREKTPFVNGDARGGSRSRLQEVWNDTWVVQMPVA